MVIVGSAFAVRRGLTGGFLRELDLRGAGLNRSRWSPGRPAGLDGAGLRLRRPPGCCCVAAGTTTTRRRRPGWTPACNGVADEPYGPALLLALLAVGLAAFAVYCLFDARYRKA